MELYNRFSSEIDDAFASFPDEDVIKNTRYYHLRPDAVVPPGTEERLRRNNMQAILWIATQAFKRGDGEVNQRAMRTYFNLRRQHDNG